MYEKGSTLPPPSPMKEPEHISMARDIANDLMSRFGEFHQNECLSVIRQMFIERRNDFLSESRNRAKELEESIAILNTDFSSLNQPKR